MLAWKQPHAPDGRILGILGQYQIGTIQPVDWSWTLDVPGHRISGRARSELAAKSAFSNALRDWIRRAGLTEAA